ncbi:hypothetical protein ACFLZT_00500 [Thermodesulfobacteriota bacterium]
MKDFISKITFGFIMAQFVPGVITVFSLSMLYVALLQNVQNSVTAMATSVVILWASSFTKQIIFIALCTGAGMVIHGLQWSVLGFLETPKTAVFDTWFHKQRLIFQILTGPIIIIIEIIKMLLFCKSTRDAVIEENVQNINKQDMEAFNFLQDFYLHFAQFYVHTSYALISSLICVLIISVFFGFSIYRIEIILLIYFFCGLIFSIGRIQFASLFCGEWDLVNKQKERNKVSATEH